MPKGSNFKGSIPALITPFKKGEIDAQAFQRFVEWQIEQGSDGLVPCGTTGESATLSEAERMRVVELCVEAARRRVPVMAGTGTNKTAATIELSRHAKKAGADAVLIVTPYYNKPTQEGLYQHFKAVHDAVDIPIFIYNIPGRSAVDMTIETMARLAKLPNIVGVKDATNDLTRPLKQRLAIGPDFCQLSGEDPTVVSFLAAGGAGCITVTGNIAPRMCSDMQRAWREGNVKKAIELQDRLLPVHLAMFCETNPGPVKYAASLLGKCAAELRLPLCEIAEGSKQQVKAALAGAGLLVERAA